MRPLGLLLLLALLVACGPDEDCCAPDPTPSPSPSAPAAPSAAEAFVAYAGGGDPDVPWAESVRFTITGEPIASLDPETADRRDSWRGCPPSRTFQGAYEGRDCPVDVLRTLAAVTTVVEPDPPRVIGCNRYTPPATGAVTTVYLRPVESRRDCFTDLAVAVGVDASGDVVAVDLAISGP